MPRLTPLSPVAFRLRTVVRAAFLFACLLLLTAATTRAQNPVAQENAKPGTTAWQLTDPALNREIEGYASLTSVNRGGQISIYVNTAEPSYTVEIYRMGWYGGAGGRRVSGPVTRTGTAQVTPAPNAQTGLVECNWTNPYVVTVPNNTADATDWMSGVYLAKLTAATSRKQSYVIFVVRHDARASSYLFQTSVTTYQAYNNWGGKSLYTWNSTSGVAASKVSFNRPYARSPYAGAASGVGSGEFIVNNQPGPDNYLAKSAGWEYNMVRWLEREGYDVTYATNLDTHAIPNLLTTHKGFLSVGHDEYWSWQMRSNVEAARDAGVSLGFFSSNTCYWQVRFEPGVGSAPNRTMVGYKDKSFTSDPYALDADASNDHLITTTWRSNNTKPPEDALIGVMYEFDPVDTDIVVGDASHWVYANTGLRNGDRLPGLLGYEADRMFGNAPAGTQRLARSHYNGGALYSDMTVYTASSGATVFATGSMQWSWGLDNYNAPALRPVLFNTAAQQMTRNVLASFVGFRPPSSPPPSAFTLLGDDFNDNSRNTAKWSFGTIQGAIYSGPTAWDPAIPALERNQRLEVTPLPNLSGDHYNGYVSAQAYNFTNASANIEVLQTTGGPTNSTDTQLAVCLDPQNFYMIVAEDGYLYFQQVVTGSRTSAYVVYDAAQHRFWRIRHSPFTDTVSFETSADNVSWVVRRTVAREMNITAMKVEISAGTWQPIAVPGTAVFDNFLLETFGAGPSPTPTPTPTPTPAPTPANKPPVAKPGGPYTGNAGSSVQFNGSASSDPDGTITAYQWEFGDGKTATGSMPRNTYASGGTYTVKLTVTDNKGAKSSATTTATITGPPAAPTNLNATSTVRREVVLTWNDSSTNETQFRIERRRSSSSSYSQIATVGANVKTYKDTSGSSGTTYYYRVRASNASGNSSYSNTDSVRVD